MHLIFLYEVLFDELSFIGPAIVQVGYVLLLLWVLCDVIRTTPYRRIYTEMTSCEERDIAVEHNVYEHRETPSRIKARTKA